MKIFIIILISFLLISPLLTNAISPESVTPENLGGVTKITPAPVQDVSRIVRILAAIVKWIYIIFFIIAVMFILFAAFNYLTGGDEPEKIKTVYKQLTYAAIAIAIALLAISFQLIIKNFLITSGGGGDSGGAYTEY